MDILDLVDAVKGHCAVYAENSSLCQFVCDELTDKHIRQAIEKSYPLDQKNPEQDAIEIVLEYAEGVMEYMNYLADPEYY